MNINKNTLKGLSLLIGGAALMTAGFKIKERAEIPFKYNTEELLESLNDFLTANRELLKEYKSVKICLDDIYQPTDKTLIYRISNQLHICDPSNLNVEYTSSVLLKANMPEYVNIEMYLNNIAIGVFSTTSLKKRLYYMTLRSLVAATYPQFSDDIVKLLAKDLYCKCMSNK